MDEDQACVFIKHLIKKWKARNKVITTKFSSLLTVVSLSEFTSKLKSALKSNKFFKDFVKDNYGVNQWGEIFNVVEYDETKARQAFREMCPDGSLNYEKIKKEVVDPLAGVLATTANKMYNI